ncbi:CHAT domain-containing protein [Kitasatospora sp. NPDC059673]|uniref:CHAT domain-containing protein n=1 Tax=Kitasatospora sp. NPDC059673 TaxID=3346901 RepID=UPI0036A7DBBB
MAVNTDGIPAGHPAMTADEAIALLTPCISLARADPAAALTAWFTTPEAYAATAVLRAGGVPPATDLPLEHAFALGYGDLFGYLADGQHDQALLGEGLLCLLPVRQHMPEWISPELAPLLAVAAGDGTADGGGPSTDGGGQVPDGGGPSVGQANVAAIGMVLAFRRWRYAGAPASAVRLLRRVVAQCPSGVSARGSVLSTLGAALLADWLDRAELSSLAESVEIGRAAVAAVPGAPGEQARRHANLGVSLRFWSDVTQSEGAIQEAVSEIRTGLARCPPEDPQWATTRLELGFVLAHAAVLFGEHAVLPEAADLLREALRRADGAADPSGYPDCLSYLGMVLIAQAAPAPESEPDPEPMARLRAEGVALCRRAAELAPTEGLRLQHLCNLSHVLLRSTAEDDAGATALALAAARQVVGLAPGGTALSADALTMLAHALTRRYQADRDPQDLAEAVARAVAGFEATSPQLPVLRLVRGAALADLLGLRAVAEGSDAPSAESLALLRRLVTELARPTAERAQALRLLADHLLDSAVREGRDERAAEAVTHYRECLELPSPGPDFEADVRFSLGTALALGTGQDGGDAWRQAAASMSRAAALFPPGDPRRLDLEARLGAHWIQRAEDTGDPTAYREGVAVLGAVVAADDGCPASDRVDHRLLLGAALLALLGHGGENGMLDRAVEHLEQALAMAPPGAPQRLAVVHRLAAALDSSAVLRSDTAPLDRASALLSEALADPRGDVADRADCLVTLGNNLRLRFQLTGGPEHLEQAAARHREAIALTAPEPHAYALDGLATCLADLYGFRPDGQLRAEAMDHCRAALLHLPEHAPERASVQAGLGYLQWSLAVESGSDERMDAALGTLKAALASAPEGYSDRCLVLTNLGAAMLGRAARTGDRSWTMQAVAVFRTALEHTAPGSARRPMVLNNLGTALFDLSTSTGDAALRERALALLSEAADQRGGMSLARERAALNLATVRFQQARSAEDAAAAVEACRRLEDLVVELGSPHPLRTLALARLGFAGLHTSDLLPERPARAALRRAAAAAREALADTTHAPDPMHAAARQVLATAQLRRAEWGERVDLAEAMRLIRQTAEDLTLPPHTRLRAARLWGGIAAGTGRSAEALEGFAHAVGLLSSVAPRHLARIDQEDRLSSGRGLASSAAALAILAGDPARALALLEQGRGVLLAQGLENQGDLSRLRELDPVRAAEFERIRDRLGREHPALQPVGVNAPDAFFVQGMSGAGAAALRDAEERHALSRRWDQLLEEIRELPELDDFLRPPTTRQLLSVAERGPVVVVNVSGYGSHALILTARGGGAPRIDVLPLPDLTPEEVAAAALVFDERWIDAAYGDEGLAQAKRAMQMHGSVLAWLWDGLAAPVLDRLGLRGTPLDGEEWPRLWWCPAGRLAFLPLHAAGKGRRLPGTWVLDRVVSSYTPTVRSLLRARRRTTVTASPRRRPAPLVVALAHTPGGPPLPGAEAEAALVTELFPGGVRLDGAQATVEQVRRALYRHSWVHFSCHGVSDPGSPSNSGLILHDGRLSALDLFARRPVDAELAFLSACSTSQGGHDLPDEAVHLAPSFQLAGFTHVIGTLWSVSDKVARRVTGDFYAALAADDAAGLRPFDPAPALHHAVRSLRERLLPAPHLWAAHLHIGP